jgi:hypothetical protein
MLGTTWRLDVAVPVEHHAFQDSIDTDAARRRKDNDRVRAGKAQIECVGVVAINNPALLCEEGT